MFLTIPAWSMRKRYLVVMKDFLFQDAGVPPSSLLEWRTLAEAQIPDVLAICPRLSRGEIRRRFEEGQECHLGWVEGRLVHFRWEAQKPAFLPYLGKKLQPLEGDLLITEVFTNPKFRGRGIYTASLHQAFGRARELGFRRVIGLAASWNTPALLAMEKTGRRVVGTVGYWNILGYRRYFGTGDVRFEQDHVLVI